MFELRISKEIHRRVFELTLALYRVTDFFPQEESLRKHMREKANEIFGELSEYGCGIDVEREATRILTKIETMRGYLMLARDNRFVRSVNITVLLREYNILADFFVQERGDVNYTHREPKEENDLSYNDLSCKDVAGEKANVVRIKKPLVETPQGTAVPRPTMLYKEVMREASKKTYNNERSGKSISNINTEDNINDRQKKILSHLKENKQAKISNFYSLFREISSKTIQRDIQDLVSKNMVKKEGDKRWTMYSLRVNVL